MRPIKPTKKSPPVTKDLEKARSEMANLKSIDIVAFNNSAEAMFVAMLKEMLASGEGVECGIVYREFAFELDVSTETIKRYLLKHTATRASFRIERNQVFLR